MAAAANIAPPWVCGWPNSTQQQTGYTLPPPPQLILNKTAQCGSFSVKNDRPLEFTWTTLHGARIGAHITRDPLNPHSATITFHPVVSIHIQGSWYDSCIMNMPQLLVPHPAEFRIQRAGLFQALVLGPQDPFSYRVYWPGRHTFIIGGIPWEDFVQQISMARQALVGPVESHNFKKL
jgi:hypothetical protein